MPQTTRTQVGGEYEILADLGQGGMAEVFKARHRRLGRTVALKMLPPHLLLDDEASGELLLFGPDDELLLFENELEEEDEGFEEELLLDIGFSKIVEVELRYVLIRRRSPCGLLSLASLFTL